MTDKDFYKTFFKNYGILCGIIVTVFVVMFYSVKLSRKSWNENLKKSVETVLEEKLPEEWFVGNAIHLKNNLSSNAAAYQIRNKKDFTDAIAVIIRTQTFYGPIPAVYIYQNQNGEVQNNSQNSFQNEVVFVGYSSVHGIVERQLMFACTDKRIQYWQQKIPAIIALSDISNNNTKEKSKGGK